MIIVYNSFKQDTSRDYFNNPENPDLAIQKNQALKSMPASPSRFVIHRETKVANANQAA